MAGRLKGLGRFVRENWFRGLVLILAVTAFKVAMRPMLVLTIVVLGIALVFVVMTPAEAKDPREPKGPKAP